MAAIRDIRTINSLLTEAERQANALGEPRPSAEHLVLAALLLEDDSARALLGIDADRFRAALTQVHAEALESVGVAAEHGDLPATGAGSGIYRSEPSAQEVFQRARVLAKLDHPAGLSGAHIVRAAAEREHGTVARALGQLGIDRRTLIQ